ncbi:chitin synthase 6 [Moniliophthora roreri]|nr:chitin synthase 6 [Moniliophthora roreri]
MSLLSPLNLCFKQVCQTMCLFSTPAPFNLLESLCEGEGRHCQSWHPDAKGKELQTSFHVHSIRWDEKTIRAQSLELTEKSSTEYLKDAENDLKRLDAELNKLKVAGGSYFVGTKRCNGL